MIHQGRTESLLAVPFPKKMKLCPPASFSSGDCDVVSFGWGDFPVLLGHSGWDDFPLPLGQSPSSPRSSVCTHDESIEQTLVVCPCAFHKSPTSAVVDNSKQDNFLAHIIERSDSDEDIDVDVDNNSTDMAPNNLIENQVSTITQGQTQARITKRVQFTTVQVREHAVTLGDHPLVESYPICLDWAHAPVQVMRVDDCEAKRSLRPLYDRYNRPRARRMTPLERRVRLEQIMGVTPSALEGQEEVRCLELQRESCFLNCSDEDLVNKLLSTVANLGDDLLEMSL
jgi:hypothetical protein